MPKFTTKQVARLVQSLATVTFAEEHCATEHFAEVFQVKQSEPAGHFKVAKDYFKSIIKPWLTA